MIEIAKPVMVLKSIGFFFDWLQSNCQGLIIAVNKQALASVGSLLAMLVVSLPIGYYLGICLDWGLYGLWIGYLAQNLCLTVSFLLILIKTDWINAAQVASKDEVENKTCAL